MKLKKLNRGYSGGLTLLFTVSLLAPPCFAKGAGSSSANFLKIPVGGRGAAMGKANTAAVDDVMALYWNPSGLALLSQNEVGLMHNRFFQGVDQDVFYYAHPTLSKGTFGGGMSLVRVGGIDGYSEGNVPSGNLSASDLLLTLGWARPWENLPRLPGLKTGVNVKLLKKDLAGDSATAYMLDLGFLYEAREGLFQKMRTGLIFQNLGSGPAFDREKSDLPRAIKGGIAYPLFGDNVTLALDIVSPSDGKMSLHMGTDYRLWDILAVRIGYGGGNDLDTGLAYGFRVGNERLHMDYAFTPFGVLGDSHRVSVGFRFGRVYRKQQVQGQIKQAYERAESQYAQGYLVQAYIQAKQIMDVAPWHRPSRSLMRHIEAEFKQLEDVAREEQLQTQIDEHFTRGEQHFQLDDLLPAKREFETILALQPDHAGSRTYLKRIDERFRGIVQSFYETAMSHFASGDYKKAKDYLGKVLVVDPNHAEAIEQLSRTEKLLEETEKAAADQARNAAIRPLHHSALTSFGQKNYEEALGKFDEIFGLDPENNEAKRYRLLCRDLLAKESYEAGNQAARNGTWVKANDLFKKALKYKPNYPEAQKGLERVRGHLGEQNKGESQKFYKLGLESFLSGEQDKALENWQKAVELDPENLEARRGIERILQKRGTP